MVLCMIGTGYVGLVTGAVLADLGNDVICVDRDAAKIDMLRQGKMPIYEPGLAGIVDRNVRESRLSFSTDIGPSVAGSDILFIAVGTPLGVDGFADLSAVRQVAGIIARNMNGYKIVVNKSTVPVGTADEVAGIIEAHHNGSNAGFDVVSNPEFLREGAAVYDTLHPDRIVIGSTNRQAAEAVMSLYAPLECPVILTDPYSAEMIKYASNAFLATKISFINAIAGVCEAAGADVTQVAEGMGYDKRIGREFLNAGLGYGGSCFGKDTQCLVSTASRFGHDFRLLRSVIDINAEQPRRFISKMHNELGSLRGRTIAVLGLAFKPNTDDLRDAKSLEVIAQLLADGAVVKAYDPMAMENARRIFPQIDYCPNPYEALDGADAAALVTEWDEFESLDWPRAAGCMAQAVVFDGRNLYDPDRMSRLGIRYHCIGRPAGRPASVAAPVGEPLPSI